MSSPAAQLEELVGFVQAAEENVRLEALRRVLVSVDKVPDCSFVAPAVAPLVSSPFEPMPIRKLATVCLANTCDTIETSTKAAKAAPQLLPVLVDSLVMTRSCAWAGCANPNTPNLMRCTRCKAAWYCSRDCLALHWKSGHKSCCNFTAKCTEKWSEEDLSLLSSMALVNLTRSEENCRDMVTTSPKSVDQLMYAFSVPPPKNLRTHVACIVTNLSQNLECRKRIMPLLFRVRALFLDPEVEVRRAVFRTLRNMCFDKENHAELLKEPMCLLTILITAMRGRKELDEKDLAGMPKPAHEPRDREADKECRQLIIETLILLGTERKSREAMREAQVYPIMRDYDLEETDEGIKTKIIDVVDFLIRDEEPLNVPNEQKDEPQSTGPIIEEI